MTKHKTLKLKSILQNTEFSQLIKVVEDLIGGQGTEEELFFGEMFDCPWGLAEMYIDTDTDGEGMYLDVTEDGKPYLYVYVTDKKS